MTEERPLDEIRRQIQESLAQSKREQLRDEYGMLFESTDSRLSPEAQNEWLDSVLEFERQFEQAQTISVRERIGNPPLEPVENIPTDAFEEVVDSLLDMLVEHGIAIDFMGEWTIEAMYRFIVDELLDEEMDDIRIEGMITHFEATTPEYDVEMWTDIFVGDVFWQEHDYFLSGLENQPLYDENGEPMPTAKFVQKIEVIWTKMQAETRVSVHPVTTEVKDDEGSVTAVITWIMDKWQQQITSTFRLQPSPYGGWDVVQTSLLDDLLALL